MFVKLYETAEHGQILVKLDMATDGCPEVRFYFKPKGLGVCAIAIAADDTDAGWAAMEAAFAQQTEESASATVANAKLELMGIVPDLPQPSKGILR